VELNLEFDPMTQEKKRCFTTLVQSSISIIESYYGTGGDLNVDEIRSNPMTEECGVWHPQEGVWSF
jgi:hypothetical protein